VKIGFSNGYKTVNYLTIFKSMILKDLYSREIEKISFLKDVNYRGFRFSGIMLFREYQSRLFKWKNKLNIGGPDFFNKSKSYHNLFIDLSPNWLAEIFSEEVIVNDLKGMGVKNINYGLKEYQGYFIHLYLNWEIFKAKAEITTHKDLAHPYELYLRSFQEVV